MASQDSDQTDSLEAFWDALRKEAERCELDRTRWYKRAKQLALEAGRKKFTSRSNFYLWIANKRKGRNYWAWDESLQFVVQAVVGTDEDEWNSWRDRWEALRRPGDERKGTSERESKESSSRGKWVGIATGIIALIAALVSIYTNIFSGSNKSAGDIGGPHTTTSSPASPSDQDPGCRGQGCAGKDPERSGCGDDAEAIFSDAPVDGPYQGVVIRVKRSATCQAVWGKMTGGMAGDMIEIFGGGSVQRDTVIQFDDKYTPMLPVSDGMHAKVCVTRKNEERYCAKPVPVENNN